MKSYALYLFLGISTYMFSEYECVVIGSQNWSKIEVHEKEKYLESIPDMIERVKKGADWIVNKIGGDYLMIMHSKEWSIRSLVDGEMKYFPESTEESGCDKFENKKNISYVCSFTSEKSSSEWQNYAVIDKDELTMEIQRTYLPPLYNPYNDEKETWEIRAVCSSYTNNQED